MIQFNLYDFISLILEFDSIQSMTRSGRWNERTDSFDPFLPLDDDLKQWWNEFLGKLEKACIELELESALDHIPRIRNTLNFGGILTPHGEMHDVADPMKDRIYDQLRRRLFAFIPPSQAKYYEQEELFGHDVAMKFPEANKEIKEAGNCYAAGNNTACVFHLMRAVELGVRPLLKRLKIKTPRPAQLMQWGEIYKEIEDAIKKLPTRTSLKASARSEFCNHAAAQFRNFKDAWRNHVSHTRTSYDEHQAMSVLVNVRQFMQHLATRLKE